jgi:DNA-binding response OmpR family regulator
MMPGVSGLDVCRQLKNDRRTQHVPVIIISAYTNAVTRAEGQLAGAIDFINKPCSPYQLLDKIRAVTQPPTTPPPATAPNEDASDRLRA